MHCLGKHFGQTEPVFLRKRGNALHGIKKQKDNLNLFRLKGTHGQKSGVNAQLFGDDFYGVGPRV